MKFQSIATTLINMVVTFFQGGFAVWAATGFSTDQLAIGAFVAAGLSALWNLIIKPFLVARGWLPKPVVQEANAASRVSGFTTVEILVTIVAVILIVGLLKYFALLNLMTILLVALIVVLVLVVLDRRRTF